MKPTKDRPTFSELEHRWKNALNRTQTAVRNHPAAYRELKSLARDIVENPLDIKCYMPTVQKMAKLLCTLDPYGQGSIFHYFNDRISPSSIWQVHLFRMECRDLLAHLKAFDQWRIEHRGLKIIK